MENRLVDTVREGESRLNAECSIDICTPPRKTDNW